MSTFAVGAIFKNETTNLKEWLDHYIWQGVSHFYLADNESNDNPNDILESYIEKGIVTYINIKGNGQQVPVYRYFTEKIQKLENPPEWILFADIDEFWFGEHKLLKDALKDYSEDIHVIYRSWREFGPSEDGFQPKSLRKELIYRNPLETSPKFIFRTLKIPANCVWIHEIRDYPENYQIREKNNIQCHHYYCQSLEYWNTIKIPRGYVNGDMSVYAEDGIFEKRSRPCIFLDTTLSDMVKYESP
jgi:hypothetical protein